MSFPQSKDQGFAAIKTSENFKTPFGKADGMVTAFKLNNKNNSLIYCSPSFERSLTSCLCYYSQMLYA
jgi:hypothetical protein